VTKTQAIDQICREADIAGVVLSSQEIVQKAGFLLEDSVSMNKRRNEFNVLSSRNSGSRQMRPITTLNALTMPVLRDLTCSSAAEFLGEEFWTGFTTSAERMAVKRTFEYMRARITRGMC
jgi:hypothetical protein